MKGEGNGRIEEGGGEIAWHLRDSDAEANAINMTFV